jgi:hypothetical protein
VRTKLSLRDLAWALTKIPAKFDIGWGFIWEIQGFLKAPDSQFGNLAMGHRFPGLPLILVAGREGKRVATAKGCHMTVAKVRGCQKNDKNVRGRQTWNVVVFKFESSISRFMGALCSWNSERSILRALHFWRWKRSILEDVILLGRPSFWRYCSLQCCWGKCLPR